jgi:hypothetical protein
VDARGLEARDRVGALALAVEQVEVVRAGTDAVNARLEDVCVAALQSDGLRIVADDLDRDAFNQRRPHAEDGAPVLLRTRAELKLPARPARRAGLLLGRSHKTPLVRKPEL